MSCEDAICQFLTASCMHAHAYVIICVCVHVCPCTRRSEVNVPQDCFWRQGLSVACSLTGSACCQQATGICLVLESQVPWLALYVGSRNQTQVLCLSGKQLANWATLQPSPPCCLITVNRDWPRLGTALCCPVKETEIFGFSWSHFFAQGHEVAGADQ